MTNPRNPAMDNAQVTEADRKAAADLINTFPLSLGWANRDDLPTQLVQAFARHRLERPVAEIERLTAGIGKAYAITECFKWDSDEDVFRLLDQLREVLQPLWASTGFEARAALGDASSSSEAV